MNQAEIAFMTEKFASASDPFDMVRRLSLTSDPKVRQQMIKIVRARLDPRLDKVILLMRITDQLITSGLYPYEMLDIMENAFRELN